MKLKCRPEDFLVEELPEVQTREQGPYTFYRLTKRGIGTLEAVELIARGWNLAGRQISYGGLKDKHAVTVQYLTIAAGPSHPFQTKGIELEPLGKVVRPYGPGQFRGNRFQVVIRDLKPPEAEQIQSTAGAIAAQGLPNYFDDQRFGSVGYSRRFIGHAWLVGDHEDALRLALAEPNPFDRSGVKRQKEILRQSWGYWAEAKSRLERSSTRSIVTYLVDHPTDFRGAFARLRRELRTLYFSAFQSHLWNLVLARLLERSLAPGRRVMVDMKVGTFPFPIGLDSPAVASFRDQAIPLPSSRNPEPGGLLGEAAREVLGEFSLAWQDVKIKHLKDIFFSKGSRAAFEYPQELTSSLAADELHPGKSSVSLSFSLNKGSYATILVKRLTETESG
jgi:tRNA pseudouridine13 synthase